MTAASRQRAAFLRAARSTEIARIMQAHELREGEINGDRFALAACMIAAVERFTETEGGPDAR